MGPASFVSALLFGAFFIAHACENFGPLYQLGVEFEKTCNIDQLAGTWYLKAADGRANRRVLAKDIHNRFIDEIPQGQKNVLLASSLSLEKPEGTPSEHYHNYTWNKDHYECNGNEMRVFLTGIRNGIKFRVLYMTSKNSDEKEIVHIIVDTNQKDTDSQIIDNIISLVKQKSNGKLSLSKIEDLIK